MKKIIAVNFAIKHLGLVLIFRIIGRFIQVRFIVFFNSNVCFWLEFSDLCFIFFPIGEKPYPCDLCGKRFRMKGDMRRHIKIHTKTKPLLKEKEKSPEKDENSSSSSSAILKSKPTSGTLLQDSKEEMKIEKEEAQVETEHDDNSDDVKRNVANEETASSPPSDAASREDTKLSSNFPIDNNGAMYVWPLFIS